LFLPVPRHNGRERKIGAFLDEEPRLGCRRAGPPGQNETREWRARLQAAIRH
jgi:hypothetical protein